ncbi:MAG: hypothetical protein SFV24_15340 [Gemmatimonadales bacterium]|nr:hypothetical protein [Gemmatimonadales bacterium]
MGNGRIVTRHLRYAWLEYEDHRDGVFFDRTMSGTLGWRNLFLDLPPSAGNKRIDRAHTDLDIRWLADPVQPTVQGLVARPRTADADFLGQWLINPGVKRIADSEGELTFGADATDHADLVAISGHGAGGRVFGKALPGGAEIDLKALMTKHAATPTSGQLKYLVIASCFNASNYMAKSWLPILTKAKPLRGILGYSDHYLGDAAGADVTRRFGALLQKNPTMPIYDAWRQANEATNQPWGAILRVEARKDNLIRWVRGHLDELSADGDVVHVDATTFPTGVAVTDKPVPFRSDFGDEAFYDGLVAGRPGTFKLFAAKGHTFKAGTTTRLVFFYYRPAKTEMDLDRLLSFDPMTLPDGSPGIRKLVDANVKKKHKTGRVDGLEITVAADTETIALPFRVLPDAIKHFPADPNGAGTHGLFWTYLFPNGADSSDFAQGFHGYENAALLRSSPRGGVPTR